MGTSSPYNGPKRSPLLPSDFEVEPGFLPPNEDTPEKQNGEEHPISTDNPNGEIEPPIIVVQPESISPKWTAAKNAMSKFATGNSSNIKQVTSRYIQAYGSARNASRSARSGIKTTVRLGNFLTTVSNNGIRESLRQANIQYEGKSAQEVLNEVINFIAPIPITKEDSVARKALIVTMEELYVLFDTEGKDIIDLAKINKETYPPYQPHLLE